MWQKNYLTYLFISILLAILASFFYPQQQTYLPTKPNHLSANPQFPRFLQDEQGEQITVSAYPQRIVSQTLATDEILLALCPPSRLIAVSALARDQNYSLVTAQAQQVAMQTVGGIEQILSLQPDLIFIASYSRAEMVALLQNSGIPLIRFTRFDNIKDIQQHIRMVGYAIGTEQLADNLIKEMNQRLAKITTRLPHTDKPLRVLSYDLAGYTAGKNTTFDDMLHYLNAINVLAEQGIIGHSKISVENIAKWQPDVIISGANADVIEQTRQQLLNDPVIATTHAGQTGRIIVLDNRYLLSVSQHIVTGIEKLADALYQQ
ncbi:ABC transporter substrate-binding protein [Beggiatoa leptomitoformis]|uniref:ABC transporter substrate-binding protein n=1 Tax=Beggiatoa leptomitoformis TaxID=288004 RepID=A0A2N9YEY2_9GAMM|nr:ABC transporter substrate-binding protein [Beggiatoa leptomitoformis]ALG68604.1 ABC transporter substrate-binding protein [Beggiatoa leptomitoformis]AUI69051.1 ABC transporter substrate-binding protein [Beggiatoa leptomitoformis]